MSDIFASFTKVEEVRDAVSQLEQGKASTGRSETLLEAMNSTLQLQQKLNEKLQKVVSGMNAEDLKVKEKETHLEKRTRHETDDNDNDSSSDSSSSSSSNDEDDEEEIDQRKKRKLPEKPTLSGKKDSADLSLAHKALDTISKIKVVNRRIDLEISSQWTKALFDLKLILDHQSIGKTLVQLINRLLRLQLVRLAELWWSSERFGGHTSKRWKCSH
ncbi:uncharacterized protein PITG_07704 [Phytophthora infestans T30-4]|uniref:Uncharacterized protein n=1 Tax=Phytophthora infestans (strain T30-4) TaxID=403677 RepID=D0N8X7_PHYIT|nr:uncharacterized protein PITG_07704 [Phytophthora infestans T30-4]EEY54012.1 conserved hypothetical protein [Phytophthora infestans T30-4]|eukprot:XP_002904643.1 conserved hypothetical protein [Phytophthora infestans T30-4]